MEDLWNELLEGEIHLRDNLQFELKSEFSIHPHLKKNTYKQEVFLFIPNALQIDSQSYSKEQFYLDETNIIRYKTPSIDFQELIDPSYEPSPLNRIKQELNQNIDKMSIVVIADEIKLFGAIFKVNIRDKVYRINKELVFPSTSSSQAKIPQEINYLLEQLTLTCETYRTLAGQAKSKSEKPELHRYFKYIDEYLSTTLNDYLLLLVKQLRNKDKNKYHEIDVHLCAFISKEKAYRKKQHLGPKSKGPIIANEMVLYRQRILNHFVLESLKLKSHRSSLEGMHSNILGAFAAGIAMFIYMGLLVWHSSTLVINSFPFVIVAVVLYILKDRVKEGLKNLFHRQISQIFPDYSTVIKSPKNYDVGNLTENVNFISPKQLAPEFVHIRNHHFHDELQALRRHESIIHYKREVTLNTPPGIKERGRRKELTTIFCLNLLHFLRKAENPYEEKLILDPYSQRVKEKPFPQVYHINIIIQNTFVQNDLTIKSEIKTFRVVVDKRGIKRVEQI